MSRYVQHDYTDDEIDMMNDDRERSQRRCTCRSTSIEPCDYCDGSMDCDTCESPDCIGDCNE